jgi:hypothetical protein
VFENRVLRRIFGHKRGEATEGWRTLNEELLGRACNAARVGEMLKEISVGKSEGKRSLGKSRLR